MAPIRTNTPNTVDLFECEAKPCVVAITECGLYLKGIDLLLGVLETRNAADKAMKKLVQPVRGTQTQGTPRGFSKKMKFPGHRQKSYAWDWKTSIRVIIELPGSRANQFRSKYCVDIIAKHLMPRTWTLQEKTERLSEMMATLEPAVEGKERGVVDRLQLEIGGEREVACEGGFVDLITEDYVIEVKNIKSWKGALGQVLVYGNCFPNRKKVVFLFYQTENITNEKEEFIISNCEKYDVLVFFKKIF